MRGATAGETPVADRQRASFAVILIINEKPSKNRLRKIIKINNLLLNFSQIIIL
jgi:hypothetical protein